MTIGGRPRLVVITRCFDDAFRIAVERPVFFLASFLLATTLAALAVVSVVGIVLVLPALAVGVTRLCLELHDDDARLATLWSGFRDYGTSLRRMLPVGVFLALATLPAGVFQAFALMSGDGALLVAGGLVGVAWNALLLYPLLFAVPLVADRGLSAGDALVTAWSAASGARLRFAAASVVTELVAWSGLLALGFGLVITWPFAWLMFASAHRQVFGPPSASPAG